MSAEKIAEATVVYTLRLRMPGSTVKVNTNEVTIRAKHADEKAEHAGEADSNSLKLSKDLIKNPKYKEIAALDSWLRGYLRSQALPTKLAQGRYLIPVASVEKIDATVLEGAGRRAKLIEELMALYPTIIEEAKGRLKELFDADDFPKAERFKNEFDLTTSIEALADPGEGLAKFSAALYKRECEKAEAARKVMVDEIRDAMRLAMAQLVRGLCETLSPSQDGKSKKVMGHAIEKLRGFLDEFQARNVTQDGELAKLVGQARELLGDVDPTKVRASTTLRASLASDVEKLRDALDGMATSDGSTLRASFLEIEGGNASSAPLPAPEAGERAARLDLMGAEAPAPAPATELQADEEPAAPAIPSIEEILAHETMIPRRTSRGWAMAEDARRAMAERKRAELEAAAKAKAPKKARKAKAVRTLELDETPVSAKTIDETSVARAAKLDLD